MHVIKINSTGYPNLLWSMWGYGHRTVSIVSPQLMNIQYAYAYDYSSYERVYTYIKRIDWDNERFYYVRQMDWRKLYEIGMYSLDIYNSSSTYYLGDDYLLVRNDSANSTLTVDPTVPSWMPRKYGYVQQAHQFIGNKLIFIKERKIDTATAKKTVFTRGLVEGGTLSVLDFEDRTRRSKGLDGWLTPMGGRHNPSLNPTVVGLFVDVFYRRYRMDGFYMWGFYNSENSIEFMRSGSDWRANKSRVEYLKHDRASASNYSVWNLEYDEDGWSIRRVSEPVPTCALLYSWRAKKYRFVHRGSTLYTVREVNETNMPRSSNNTTIYSWEWSKYYKRGWISSDCAIISFDGQLYHFPTTSATVPVLVPTPGIIH